MREPHWPLVALVAENLHLAVLTASGKSSHFLKDREQTDWEALENELTQILRLIPQTNGPAPPDSKVVTMSSGCRLIVSTASKISGRLESEFLVGQKEN